VIPVADATRALKKSGGSAKVAIVMARRKVAREEAEQLLKQSGGMLRGALES
jgi:N-acetylmuramic acid 6-phosphate (MurNAc-6-P) etherase